MTTWLIENFGGIAPKIDEKRLADELGTIAENTSFDEARLTPLQGILNDSDLGSSNTASLYRYNNTWITSQNNRSYVGALLPNDTDDKLYFTDFPDYPKIQSGGSTYRLGLPKPSVPSVVLNSAGDPDETLQESWSYIISYVDAFGFEGPGSTPTGFVTVGQGGSIDLTLPGPPSGNYNMGSGALVRIYRSNAGSSASDYQFVVDLAVSTLAYTDSTLSGALEEVLTTYDNYAAPDETSAFGAMRGLVELPGGYLAGFTKNTVHLSKAYQPHAWPYEYSTQHDIVGIVPVQGGLFVATVDKPYMLIGSTSESMLMQPLVSNQACVSEDSIVDMGGYAIYASPDGLCQVNGADVTLITEELIDAKQWQQTFNLPTLKAFVHEGKYVAFDSTTSGFTFDLSEGKNALITYSGEEVVAAHRVGDEDRLYTIYKPGGGAEQLGVWNEGTALNLIWQTKLKQFQKPVSFGYFKVYGEAGNVTVTLTADGQTLLSESVTTDTLFRIPKHGKARFWQVRVESNVAIDMIGLYQSSQEVI